MHKPGLAPIENLTNKDQRYKLPFKAIYLLKVKCEIVLQ